MKKGNVSVSILIITYLSMFLYGMTENIKAVTFPLITLDFGVQYEGQGFLVSTTFCFLMIFAFLATAMIQRYGVKSILLLGYGLGLAGLITTGFAMNFPSVVVTLVLTYAACGMFEVGANALATATFTKNSAIYMNILHFFYGLGSIFAQKAAGYVSGVRGQSWRYIYFSLIAFYGVALITTLSLKNKSAGEGERLAPHEEKPKRKSMKEAIKTKYFLHSCLLLGCVHVIMLTVTGWSGLYLLERFSIEPSLGGADFVFAYYVLYTLSRVICGPFIEKVGYLRTIAIGAVGVAVFSFLGFSLGEQGLFLLIGQGFLIGILYPTTLAAMIPIFKEDAPVISSLAIVIGGLMNAAIQMGLGYVNDYIDPKWGYQSIIFSAILLFVLAISLKKRISVKK